jgi:hypothetical protein
MLKNDTTWKQGKQRHPITDTVNTNSEENQRLRRTRMEKTNKDGKSLSLNTDKFTAKHDYIGRRREDDSGAEIPTLRQFRI